MAQDQKLSDSLATIYDSGEYAKEEELKLLKELAKSETNADQILTYSLLLITKSKDTDSTDYEFEGYLQQGNAYRLKSELTKALESYLEAAKVASDNNLKSREASINISIADVYSIMGDGTIAVKYYKQALALLNREEDALALASAQLNLGDEYYNQNKLDSALYFFNESGKIFKAKNNKIGEAYNMGNVGLVYAEMGEHERAEENLNNAIEVLEELEDYYPICVYLNAMSDVYEAKGEKKKSLTYASQSLELAQKYELKEQISDSNLKLSNFHEKYGNIRKAFAHYKDHIVYRDQVSSIQQVQQMANVRTEYEVSKKQIEVDLLNQQKKIQRYIVIGIGIALFLIGLLAVSLYKRNKFMKRTNEIIAFEKKTFRRFIEEHSAGRNGGRVKRKWYRQSQTI